MNNQTEIVTVASGKGGTGKTVILASLGYALQASGHRVLFIDSDTATAGLSLFILGPKGQEIKSGLVPQNTLSDFLRGASNEGLSSRIVPFSANRGLKDDHEQIYDILISGRGLYGDVSSENDQSAVPQLNRTEFRKAITKLFDLLKASERWDYILVDTRGGFGFETTDVCALSDSYFVVTEPDVTSFYQDKNLLVRIKSSAAELSRLPSLKMRGVIVNKATEYLPTDDRAAIRVHNLDLTSIEASFRNILSDHFRNDFGIGYENTYPVPLDIDVVDAYKVQKMPFFSYPSSIFSYAALSAFSSMMQSVGVGGPWSRDKTKRWNELVDRISDAIKNENERKLEAIRQQRELYGAKEKLEGENLFLREQAQDLKKSLISVGDHEKLRLARDEKIFDSQSKRESTRTFLLIGIMVALLAVTGVLFIELGNLRKQNAEQLGQLRWELSNARLEIEELRRRSQEAPRLQSR